MMIISNGIRLNVAQRGAGIPALVFLHYWGGSSRTWRHVSATLAADFRTIAIDQRGWGLSEAPATGYALADLAADALGVIDALDLERYVLVGHSMGGKVAQWIAGHRPRGLAGLALVAPSPPLPMALDADARQAMVQAYASRDSIMATLAHVLVPNGLDAADLEIVIEDSLRGAPAAREAWPMLASQEDITGIVARIDVPTIVMSGSDDRVDPPKLLENALLPLIPGARLHVLPNAGHILPLEAPDELADLIGRFCMSLIEGA